MKVKISQGNSKMGKLPSVSLPAVKTCRKDCGCIKKCYARRLANFRPSVSASYENNLMVLETDPETFWREIEATIMLSRFFRFHVSGDIPNKEYFMNMVDISRRNPHCTILCFTKKFDIVNNYIRSNGGLENAIPNNLRIIFSGWVGLNMDNPYKLPEAHVKFKDGTTTAREDAINCNGNCTECALINAGCWNLKPGEQVIFDEH